VAGVISLGPLINLLDGHSLGFVVWIICTLEILLEDSFSWLKVLFFRVFPFSLFFGYIYLIVAFVPVVFGFSVHLLGDVIVHSHLAVPYSSVGGVLVSTRSTLTTLRD